VNAPASDKTWLVIVAVLAGGLGVGFVLQNERNSADKTARAEVSVDFDFYLLAMTLHPAFCADGHAGKPECRAHRIVPIAIHGLWPEKLAPGRYPRDCGGPALDLAPALERDLESLMPGMADGLHVHEWRRHGTCSGLGDDEYYRHTLDLARRLDAVLRPGLTTATGARSSTTALRQHADRVSPGLGATLTFHCRTLRDAPPERRGKPFLIEIRQCVDDDGEARAPRTPLACAPLQRRDQGCGREFHIAGARMP
jgi:ribonuclease I